MTPTKRGARQKWHTFCKKAKACICQGLSRVIFKRKFLNLFMIQTHGDGILKSRFSHPQNGTRLCLIVVGVGSIIRKVLVVLQKTNNVVVRGHLYRIPFLGGGIFDKKSALFETPCQCVS